MITDGILYILQAVVPDGPNHAATQCSDLQMKQKARELASVTFEQGLLLNQVGKVGSVSRSKWWCLKCHK